MTTGPIAVRTSLRTRLPTASIMRRTCRLRPSVIVISRKVELAESRNRFTRAGRVGPSDNSKPSPSFRTASSSRIDEVFTRYVFGTL